MHTIIYRSKVKQFEYNTIDNPNSLAHTLKRGGYEIIAIHYWVIL
jgi:hypothetical protein